MVRLIISLPDLKMELIKRFNIEETTSYWKKLLNNLEGEPTAVDWNSITQALTVASEINSRTQQ